LDALVCFLIAFGVSYLGTLGLLRIPMARGFIDVPNERSSHESPKPRFGGVAIVVAFYAALGWLWSVRPETGSFLPLVVGSALLFLTGVLDDWRGLSVKARFAAQIVAAITLVSFGISLDHIYIPAVGNIDLGWFGIPLTVLFIVGSINFYNFIDGIDGLAAGSAFIAAGVLALIAMMLGHVHLSLLFLAVAGSTIGFLQFNFPPSRLFMGDSGSTFLGFFFAYAAVAGNSLSPELPVFIPLLVLSSLYLDAGLTLFNRFLKRENIFQAHHTHYYQRLLSLGLNHKQVTLLEYLVVILLGVSAIVYFKAGRYFPVFVSVCWVTLFTLAILKIRALERGDKLFWEKRTLFAIGLDLVLIAAAYLGAYFLRMNFRFTEPEGTAVLRALPIVLIVRSAVFFKFGLYRSVYKYTSTADIVRILKAITLGSAIILTIVVLLYRFVSFPRTLFVIEFFLLTLLVLGSRFSFRLFHEIGKEAHGANVRRYGIVGAGDFGERIARELRNDSKHSTHVACFIDDDPRKIGLTLHGAPIAGPIKDLAELCGKFKLDALALGIARVEPDKIEQIVDAATATGVPLEGRHSALRGEPVSRDQLFATLARGLGRGGAGEVGTPARVFYRGKRVLLTGGGGPVGPALARKLIALGASVTVLVESAQDARRFEPALRREVFIHLGSPREAGEWRAFLDDVHPEVLFHCLALDVGADSYQRDYLWEAVVMGTVHVSSSSSIVSSIVLLSFRGDDQSRDASEAGALAETVLLHDLQSKQGVAQAVRFPKIFTEIEAMEARNGLSRTTPVRQAQFAILEPEAVAVALDCAASGPRGAIVVPRWSSTFTAADAEEIVAGRSGVGDRWDDSHRNAGPLFPAETIDERELAGPLRAVVGVGVNSPIARPDEETRAALARGLYDAAPHSRRQWIETATARLYCVPDADHAETTDPDRKREKERL
jgi:UDP-GlcNAc:undecaprenyl-phosphate GlcNAc-1-phosphate transferase